MSTEPRSIRLNKTHREDMLNAVMKQWEKTNPAPAGSTFESFIKATLQHLMKVKRNAPAEMKTLKHVVERTRKGIELKANIPEAVIDCVEIATEADFKLMVQLDDGTYGATMRFKLPVAMADELKIPYIGTFTSNYSGEEFPSYADDDGAVEMVNVVNRGSWINLTIPRDFAPYTVYRKEQQALRKWEEEKAKVRSEIQDYLSQFNTTGQIREYWPEMEQYLPAHIADPARVITLPALTRSRLNERLGL